MPQWTHGFEPRASTNSATRADGGGARQGFSLASSCAQGLIQLLAHHRAGCTRRHQSDRNRKIYLVGFEPTASCSQSRRSGQAELQVEACARRDLNPHVSLRTLDPKSSASTNSATCA